MSRDDDAWAELVEAFHTTPSPDPEGRARWPEAEDIDPDAETAPASGDAAADADHSGESFAIPFADPAAELDRAKPASEDGGHDADESGHFVPPVPPPIPRGDLTSRWAWAGVIVPPIALLVISATSWDPPTWVVVAMAAGFVGGFGTLVARMRGHHPHDPDDGAVL